MKQAKPGMSELRGSSQRSADLNGAGPIRSMGSVQLGEGRWAMSRENAAMMRPPYTVQVGGWAFARRARLKRV
jgi:hypothetical protein